VGRRGPQGVELPGRGGAPQRDQGVVRSGTERVPEIYQGGAPPEGARPPVTVTTRATATATARPDVDDDEPMPVVAGPRSGLGHITAALPHMQPVTRMQTGEVRETVRAAQARLDHERQVAQAREYLAQYAPGHKFHDTALATLRRIEGDGAPARDRAPEGKIA
jgi:hypothetical protein